MNKIKFTVKRKASYDSEIVLPNSININDSDAIEHYIRSHIDKCTIKEFVWDKDINSLEIERTKIYSDERVLYTEGKVKEIRAVRIIWDSSEDNVSWNNLPSIVKIPDEFVVNYIDAEHDSDENIAKVVSKWLYNKYKFKQERFLIIKLAEEDLKLEKEKLKWAIRYSGMCAIEDFIGEILDVSDINIDKKMDNVIDRMTEDEYFHYIDKYKINMA